MDWKKLQQTLYNLDPSDVNSDIQKLKESAGSQHMASEQPANEPYTVDQGTLPTGVDSVSDFAALAGIKLDEGKQKTGKKGQARGSDKTPKKRKPSGTGEQDHPLKDKLVGEGAWDSFKSGADSKNYNNFGALKHGSNSMNNDRVPHHRSDSVQQTPTAHQTHAADIPKFTGFKDQIRPYIPAIKKIFKDKKLNKEFNKLMKRADPNLNISEPKTEESSIKEELWRRLNNL